MPVPLGVYSLSSAPADNILPPFSAVSRHVLNRAQLPAFFLCGGYNDDSTLIPRFNRTKVTRITVITSVLTCLFI